MYVRWIPSGVRIDCNFPLTRALKRKFPFRSAKNSHVDKNVASGILRAASEKIELTTCIFWRYPNGFIIGIPIHITAQCATAASSITVVTFDAYFERQARVSNGAA